MAEGPGLEPSLLSPQPLHLQGSPLQPGPPGQPPADRGLPSSDVPAPPGQLWGAEPTENPGLRAAVHGGEEVGTGRGLGCGQGNRAWGWPPEQSLPLPWAGGWGLLSPKTILSSNKEDSREGHPHAHTPMHTHPCRKSPEQQPLVHLNLPDPQTQPGTSAPAGHPVTPCLLLLIFC